jgi:polysaccharide deacetylase 2 family uncharacterized protein YibQ
LASSKQQRPSKRARAARRWRAAGLLAAVCLAALAIYLIRKRSGRGRPSLPHPSVVNRIPTGEIAFRIRAALETAGGSGVWVKGTAQGRFPASDAESPLEVLVEPAAFSPVLQSFEKESARLGLEAHSGEEEKITKGHRERVIELSLRGEPMGEWRFREVGEIRRAAIVIDDMGQELEPARELLRLPYPLTFSVLPHLAYSHQTAELAHQKGHAVMLHLPMEPEAVSDRGPGQIRGGMGEEDVVRIVNADLESVPFVSGVNNHMGSRATADPALMSEVMSVLAHRKLYFVDSRTSGASVALNAARRAGLPAFYRSVFLDDEQNVDYTLGQLSQFRRVIENKGIAVAIGHPHPSTIKALTEFLPEFAKDDIELVPASKLVRLPEVTRLSPSGGAVAAAEQIRNR